MDWGCSVSVSIELKKTPIDDGRLLIEVIKGGALIASAPCMVDDPTDRGRCIASLLHQAPALDGMGLDSKMLEQTAPRGIAPIPFGDFVRDFPAMRPEVIEGILRQGETMNIISSAKVGKSLRSFKCLEMPARWWLQSYLDLSLIIMDIDPLLQ